MLINPKVAIENGWIQGITDLDKQVQPNAIDFTVDTLYKVEQTTFELSEHSKIMRATALIEPEVDGFWNLNVGVYDVLSNMFVEVPEGVACEIITRSSLTRNGLFLQAGLYDSGFKGHVGCVIHNRINGVTRLAPGTRIGQIKFIEANSATVYDGSYMHDKGTDWREDR